MRRACIPRNGNDMTIFTHKKITSSFLIPFSCQRISNSEHMLIPGHLHLETFTQPPKYSPSCPAPVNIIPPPNPQNPNPRRSNINIPNTTPRRPKEFALNPRRLPLLLLPSTLSLAVDHPVNTALISHSPLIPSYHLLFYPLYPLIPLASPTSLPPFIYKSSPRQSKPCESAKAEKTYNLKHHSDG